MKVVKSNTINEIFETFFIDMILDIKSVDSVDDYTDVEKLLKRKRKVKEHREFLELFCKTETYNSLCKYLGPNKSILYNDAGIHVEEYLKERKARTNRANFDNKHIIDNIVDPPEPVEYNTILDLYEKEEVIVPIIGVKSNRGEMLYGYQFFPKLMDELMLSHKHVNAVKWPHYPTEILHNPATYDIFNPEVQYTKSNINIVTWIICSISTYWYHEHNEKIVHTVDLLQFLLKVISRLDKTQRQM